MTPVHPGWAERPPEDGLTRFYWDDPEPDFQGMLSSDRILAYHYKVGRIIRPLQREHLKPASYELTLGPLYVLNGKEETLTADHRELVIPPNSIAFVSMREQLFMPHWLVGRFDLSINFIYQGLLLGTGPQVDPGFQGVLSCPLHNISNEPIRLELGKPFAKIDFVKTSFGFGRDVTLPGVTSDEQLRELSPLAGYEGFPLKVLGADKTFRTPILFAPDKDPRRIKSSVRAISERVDDTAKNVRRIRTFSVAGAAGLLVLVATLFAAAVGGFLYTVNYVDGRVQDAGIIPADVRHHVSQLQSEMTSLAKENAALCAAVLRLRTTTPPACSSTP